jgi:hypothetical protein
MFNKNLIIFNTNKLTLNKYNLQDKNIINNREKNTYYDKIIQIKFENNNIIKDNYFLNNNLKK